MPRDGPGPRVGRGPRARQAIAQTGEEEPEANRPAMSRPLTGPGSSPPSGPARRPAPGWVRAIEALSEWSGRAVSWLSLGMVLLVSYDVAMRYLFRAGSVALQELEWHLFALLFLLGAAYTLRHDEHVRIDLLYQARWMTPRRRAWIDLLGTALFLIPFCLLVIWTSWPFVLDSYRLGEGSPDPGGLPARWLLKAAIPLGFLLLLLQGLALLAHSLRAVLGREEPAPPEHPPGEGL